MCSLSSLEDVTCVGNDSVYGGRFGRRPGFLLAGQMWGRSDQIACCFLKKTTHQWPGVRLTHGGVGGMEMSCVPDILSVATRRGRKPTVSTHLGTHLPPFLSHFFFLHYNNILVHERWSKITQAAGPLLGWLTIQTKRETEREGSKRGSEVGRGEEGRAGMEPILAQF